MKKIYILGAVAAVVVVAWVGLFYAERAASEDVDTGIRSSFMSDHIDYDSVTVGILSGNLTFKNLRAVSQYAGLLNIRQIGELEISSITLQDGLPLEAELRAEDVVFNPSVIGALGFNASEVNVLHAASGAEAFKGSIKLRHELDEEEGAWFSAVELQVDDVVSVTSQGEIVGVDRELQKLIADILQGVNGRTLATKGLDQLMGLSFSLSSKLQKLKLSQTAISLKDLGAFEILNEVAAYERQLYGEEQATYEAPDLSAVSMGELINGYRKTGGTLVVEIEPDTPLPFSYNKSVSQSVENGIMKVSGL